MHLHACSYILAKICTCPVRFPKQSLCVVLRVGLLFWGFEDIRECDLSLFLSLACRGKGVCSSLHAQASVVHICVHFMCKCLLFVHLCTLHVQASLVPTFVCTSSCASVSCVMECMHSFVFEACVSCRKNIRAVFNLQEENEHPSCGDGIHPEVGFSYYPLDFQNAGGRGPHFLLPLIFLSPPFPPSHLCVCTVLSRTAFWAHLPCHCPSVVLQHVLEGHDVPRFRDSPSHCPFDGLSSGSGAPGLSSFGKSLNPCRERERESESSLTSPLPSCSC